jgi:hypothetical protein
METKMKIKKEWNEERQKREIGQATQGKQRKHKEENKSGRQKDWGTQTRKRTGKGKKRKPRG